MTRMTRPTPVRTASSTDYTHSLCQALRGSPASFKKQPGQKDVVLRQHFSRGGLGPAATESARDFVKYTDSYSQPQT